MDKRQKSTLRSQHIRIADELILDEDFYAALRRDKIFTNSMLDLIRVNLFLFFVKKNAYMYSYIQTYFLINPSLLEPKMLSLCHPCSLTRLYTVG